MAELRQYQRDAANSAWRGFKEFDKQLLVLPTGAGKTIVFSKMAAHPALQPCLILAHRDELVIQAVDKLRAVTGIEAGVEKAAWHGDKLDKVVVGSIQTLANPGRLTDWPNDHFKFIVVDEAHHALSKSWQNVLSYFHSAKVLGVTATPHRGDKKNLGKFFESLAYEITLLELVKQGFLSPIMVRTIPLKIDLTSLKKVAGDYSEVSAGAALEPFLEQIGLAIKEHASNRKSLIFLPLIHTSQRLCSVLRALGLRAEHVDGNDKERKQKLEDFKNGKITHLCNAMLLTEGYDEPSIECIIPLRPTASQPLYAQMVGRGTRIFPGKDHLLLLDFLWLHEKHSLIRPAHLIAASDEVADIMTSSSVEAGYHDGEMDLEAMHRDAIAEREEALRAELAKHATKKSKTVDALEYALDIGSMALAEYEPAMPWEFDPPTQRQLELLGKLGITPETITCKGHAAKLMSAVFDRNKMGMATARQVFWLTKMRHPSPHTATEREASAWLDRKWGKHE